MTQTAANAVRFVRQYTLGSGRILMRFETANGERSTEIVVRENRQGLMLHTRAEAKIQAMQNLNITVPCPNGCSDNVVPGVFVDPECCMQRQAEMRRRNGPAEHRN